jgi:hypothetical protein
MPATPTTAPATKRALVEMFGELDGLSGVKVHYGYLNDAQQLGQENINVGKVRFNQEWGALANLRREESYRVELVVLVKRGGDDQQGTEERMWAVLAEIEQALRADPTVGGFVRVAELTEGEQDNSPDSEGWFSQVVAQITCKASLPSS